MIYQNNEQAFIENNEVDLAEPFQIKTPIKVMPIDITQAG